MGKFIDLTGQRFGRLVVVERAEDYVSKKGKRYVQYRCQCDCGNEIIENVSNLKSERSLSCGCYRSSLTSDRCLENLEGNFFGELKVIKRVEDQVSLVGHRKTRWLCECNCGNTIEVNSGSLKSGHTTSCGCKRRIKKLPYGESSFNLLYRQYERNAKKKGNEFLLDKNKFKELVDGSCFYCGEKPSQIQKQPSKRCNGEYIYNGIDRIDSSKGYIMGNVVSCCSKCNYAKREMSQQEFIYHIEKIYKHLILKGEQMKDKSILSEETVEWAIRVIEAYIKDAMLEGKNNIDIESKWLTLPKVLQILKENKYKINKEDHDNIINISWE